MLDSLRSFRGDPSFNKRVLSRHLRPFLPIYFTEVLSAKAAVLFPGVTLHLSIDFDINQILGFWVASCSTERSENSV